MVLCLLLRPCYGSGSVVVEAGFKEGFEEGFEEDFEEGFEEGFEGGGFEEEDRAIEDFEKIVIIKYRD